MIQEEGEFSVAFGVMTELSTPLDYPEFYKTINLGESKLKMSYIEKIRSLVDMTD
jgi:hypothetical protein